VLFEKVRYERPNPDSPKGYEKTLSFRHPTNDGWFWGAGTDERPLYNLQGLTIADPAEPVYLLESEKVADKLSGLNLLATCPASGWSNADVGPLRGRDCFVLVDNNADGAGEKKAAAATEAVCRVARSIRIVRKPGPPDGENLADEIGPDFSVQDFVSACRAAPLHELEIAGPNGAEAELVFVCAADVEPQAVESVWPGRLARGHLTLVTGDVDLGKSQIGLDAAARITRGAEWPDGGSAPLGSVIILSAEDAIKDTIVPRLEAAGADLGRVHILRQVTINGRRDTFSLQSDVAALGKKIAAIGDVALVIIDPVTSYMGARVNSFMATAVRAVLEPLSHFAEENRVAIFGITHPPKAAQGKAKNAFTGSLAFVATARIGFLAIEEQGTERKLLLSVKNNIGRKAPGLGYSLEQTIMGDKNIVASRVAWDTAPVTMSADEAIAAANDKPPPALAEAIEFLRQEMASGPDQ
jgi:putative DNA primase/helicase